MESASTLILYGTPPSGHVHRVEVLLRLLGLPYNYVTATADVRQTPDYLALNPLGQIPVLVDGEAVICDSTAILVYLVEKYAPDSDWLPRSPRGRAEVQRWLSIASGEVRFGPAIARAICQFKADGDLARAQAIATRLFKFMETHLANRHYLAADHPTLADLASFAYIAHAPEGGIDLAPYPAICAWLDRVKAIPGFFDMAPLALPTH